MASSSRSIRSSLPISATDSDFPPLIDIVYYLSETLAFTRWVDDGYCLTKKITAQNTLAFQWFGYLLEFGIQKWTFLREESGLQEEPSALPFQIARFNRGDGTQSLTLRTARSTNTEEKTTIRKMPPELCLNMLINIALSANNHLARCWSKVPDSKTQHPITFVKHLSSVSYRICFIPKLSDNGQGDREQVKLDFLSVVKSPSPITLKPFVMMQNLLGLSLNQVFFVRLNDHSLPSLGICREIDATALQHAFPKDMEPILFFGLEETLHCFTQHVAKQFECSASFTSRFITPPITAFFKQRAGWPQALDDIIASYAGEPPRLTHLRDELSQQQLQLAVGHIQFNLADKQDDAALFRPITWPANARIEISIDHTIFHGRHAGEVSIPIALEEEDKPAHDSPCGRCTIM